MLKGSCFKTKRSQTYKEGQFSTKGTSVTCGSPNLGEGHLTPARLVDPAGPVPGIYFGRVFAPGPVMSSVDIPGCSTRAFREIDDATRNGPGYGPGYLAWDR